MDYSIFKDGQRVAIRSGIERTEARQSTIRRLAITAASDGQSNAYAGGVRGGGPSSVASVVGLWRLASGLRPGRSATRGGRVAGVGRRVVDGRRHQGGERGPWEAQVMARKRQTKKATWGIPGGLSDLLTWSSASLEGLPGRAADRDRRCRHRGFPDRRCRRTSSPASRKQSRFLLPGYVGRSTAWGWLGGLSLAGFVARVRGSNVRAGEKISRAAFFLPARDPPSDAVSTIGLRRVSNT